MADSDAWNEIQALKSKQNSLRAKLAARRKEREGLVAEISNAKTTPSTASTSIAKSTASTSDGNIDYLLLHVLIVQCLIFLNRKARICDIFLFMKFGILHFSSSFSSIVMENSDL